MTGGKHFISTSAVYHAIMLDFKIPIIRNQTQVVEHRYLRKDKGSGYLSSGSGDSAVFVFNTAQKQHLYIYRIDNNANQTLKCFSSCHPTENQTHTHTHTLLWPVK